MIEFLQDWYLLIDADASRNTTCGAIARGPVASRARRCSKLPRWPNRRGARVVCEVAGSRTGRDARCQRGR